MVQVTEDSQYDPGSIVASLDIGWPGSGQVAFQVAYLHDGQQIGFIIPSVMNRKIQKRLAQIFVCSILPTQPPWMR